MFEATLAPAQRLLEDGGSVVAAIFVLSLVGWVLLLWLAFDLIARPRSIAKPTATDSLEHVMRRLDEEERVARARSVLGIVAVLSAASPLLGLLGTVLGMMETFSFLGNEDVPRVDALAGGVSKALITTQAGLIVALTLIAGHAWLHRKTENRARLIGS